MRAFGAGKLYTPELLRLATELSRYPLRDDLPLRAEGRSRTCGSSIKLALRQDASGRVDDIGMRVSACAVGQASAALLAQSARGALSQELDAAAVAIERWLAGEGDIPDWPGFAILEPALEHRGRHGAILLPWKAAADALSKATSAG